LKLRIKKLELCGFKSFKDRTVIHFDPGTTGIVGPNGCGKSNIVDALVWVMGEMSAKHLRGANMTDVIFAGAEGFAPMGMAEVSLVLENDGGPFPAKYARHTEIMVTRRLHRSGESEYLINKQQARLKDVHEIFMDTGAGSKGFSIIEQGAIGKIITAKPENRRSLIEEAAGITKFKTRKKESQRKLVTTDQNLVRLQDIIGEQKRQLGSLERQAQRAERYRKLKVELEDKDLWLHSKKYFALEAEKYVAEESLQGLTENEVSASSDIDQDSANLESLKLMVSELENKVSESQSNEKQAQVNVQNLEKELREVQFEVQQAERDKEMTGTVLDQYNLRKEALLEDKERFSVQCDANESEFTALSEQYKDKNKSYSEAQSTILRADEELTEARKRMLTVAQGESHLGAQFSALESQIEQDEERENTAIEVHSELKSKKDEFEGRRNQVYKKLEKERQLQFDMVKDVETFQAELNEVKQKLEAQTLEAETFKENLNEVSGKLYGLEDLSANFEGFQEGVKNVMLWQRQKNEGIELQGGAPSPQFKPVAEVVEVPQKYELAMESALGSKLQLLMSSESTQSMEAVGYLKEKNSGRSSFVSEDISTNDDIDMSAATELRAEEGYLESLSDVVKVPESFKNQVSLFLKDIAIVQDLQTALRLRKRYPEVTFVTMDGDTLSAEGILTGGTIESASSGMLKRKREIKELSQKREEWAGKFSLVSESLKKLKAQVKTMESDMDLTQQKKMEQEIRVTELKKDLERAENEFANAEKALERQSLEVSKEEALKIKHEEQKEVVSSELIELRTERLELEQKVDKNTLDLQSAKEGFDQLQESVTDLKVLVAQKEQELHAAKAQMARVENSLEEVNLQLSEMNNKSEISTESLNKNSLLIEQKKVELEGSILRAKELENLKDDLQNQYEEKSTEARELEHQVNASHRELSEYKTKLSEAQFKVGELKMKEQYLIDHVAEKYMKEIQLVSTQYSEDERDESQMEADIEQLKTKIGRIGEVNLSAIEEYDDLSERYKFLSQQYDDLIEAKDQLRKVIDRINRICTRRFKETFELVNERFEKVFPVLFGGGEARLILIENPDNPNEEMGIDIVAKPPGKRLQNVGLLSGGEKALTAVSLIFSIFLVKPSPYCLLDEVDAPLDDANVMRFNELVREMAKRSQIIVVTHNKHTMKVNNKLYGVTMENKGVSKMVSVDLDIAEDLAEI